ncbi:hypothetical protein [Thalassobaculum sp.]|uniref:hypothetical protein n=1 Tax=Thalassobaculum sp. TaxID=2022740 RepID=UPI0032ED441D
MRDPALRRGRLERAPSHLDWPPEDEERLAALYADGWTVASIAGAMGRNVPAIMTRIKHLGLRRGVTKDQTLANWPQNRSLIDQADDADDILAARMAASGGSFADHEVRTTVYGRRMSGGTAALVGWQTVSSGEAAE